MTLHAILIAYLRDAILVSYVRVGVRMVLACFLVLPVLLVTSVSVIKVVAVVYSPFAVAVWTSIAFATHQTLRQHGRFALKDDTDSFASEIREIEGRALSSYYIAYKNSSPLERLYLNALPVAFISIALVFYPLLIEAVLYLIYRDVWADYYIPSVTQLAIASTVPFAAIQVAFYQFVIVNKINGRSN